MFILYLNIMYNQVFHCFGENTLVSIIVLINKLFTRGIKQKLQFLRHYNEQLHLVPFVAEEISELC